MLEQFYTPGEVKALAAFLLLGVGGLVYRWASNASEPERTSDWTQKRISDDSLFFLLASKDLTLDSLHFYAPDTAEPSKARVTRASTVAVPPESVPINQASVEELQSLPSIGPATATLIVDYRRERGGFRTLEELMNVRGIGIKKFERLKPYLRLN